MRGSSDRWIIARSRLGQYQALGEHSSENHWYKTTVSCVRRISTLPNSPFIAGHSYFPLSKQSVTFSPLFPFLRWARACVWGAPVARAASSRREVMNYSQRGVANKSSRVSPGCSWTSSCESCRGHIMRISSGQLRSYIYEYTGHTGSEDR